MSIVVVVVVVVVVVDWCLLCISRVIENHSIMSFKLSNNGRNAILNVATQVKWTCHIVVMD